MLTQDDVARMPLDKRLDRLARTADTLVATVTGESDVVLGRRPDVKNWAPKEVLCHLRDTEEFFGVRFAMIAAMDEPRFLPVDVDRWAEERQYLRNDAAEVIRAFRRRREESLTHLRGLAPEGWQRGGVHPTRGRMTVSDFVVLMVWHDDNHLEQIRRGLKGEA